MRSLVLFAAAAALAAAFFTNGGGVSAQTPTPTPFRPGAYPLIVECGNYNGGAVAYTFTNNGTPVSSATPIAGLACSPNQAARQNIQAPASWNDLKVQYWCTVGTPVGTPAANTLDIPPRVVLDKGYVLLCPSTGAVHTPAPGDPPGDASVKLGTFIGGVAELPDSDVLPLETSDGSSESKYVLLAGIALGAILLGASGWYMRKRWLS